MKEWVRGNAGAKRGGQRARQRARPAQSVCVCVAEPSFGRHHHDTHNHTSHIGHHNQTRFLQKLIRLHQQVPDGSDEITRFICLYFMLITFIVRDQRWLMMLSFLPQHVFKSWYLYWCVDTSDTSRWRKWIHTRVVFSRFQSFSVVCVFLEQIKIVLMLLL